MKVPRQGSWPSGGGSSDHSDTPQDAVPETTRGADSQLPLKGGAVETQRRLRPVGHGLRAVLGRIAPPISRGLIALVQIPVALVVKLQEMGARAGGWVVRRARALASGLAGSLARTVTPVRTVALVCLVAAVTLGVSQFMDYRGVAVGADLYQGDVASVAQAPLRDVETAGSAHLYALLPIAAAAIVLTAMIVLGRPELWRWLFGLGLLALLVTLAIDLPTGLEAGTSGSAYASSDVEMLDGFWIQLCSAAIIALSGYLLGRYTQAEPKRGETAPSTSFSVQQSGLDSARKASL